MAFKWSVHSACHVLGYTNDIGNNMQGSHVLECPNKNVNEVVKSRKSDSGMEIKMETYPSGGFQMPLHFPRYTKLDYEIMEEWRVDKLLKEYGLSFKGTLDEKKAFAIGAFLWPDQY